ncbi:MAG: M15 family metallopeptidase [Microthrixaceae bacterium]
MSPDQPLLIDDPRVLAVPIIDNGEPLVDLAGYDVELAKDHPRVSGQANTRFWCRTSVAERLVAAAATLPTGYELAVAEAHRPLELQRHHWETDLAALRAERPELSEAEAASENAKLIAPPWIVPPHSTGGAVDVVLLIDGREVPMGSALNERCPAMRTDHEPIDPAHRHHRGLLSEAMGSAGFVNYGHEWWHYSYGDRYWALSVGADHAIYDGR